MDTPRTIKPPPVRARKKDDEAPTPTPEVEGVAPTSAPPTGDLTPEEIAAALSELYPDLSDEDDEAEETAAWAQAQAQLAAGQEAKASKARTPTETAPAPARAARSAPARTSDFVDFEIVTHNGYEVTDHVDARSAERLIINAMRTPGVEHWQDKTGCVVIVTPRAVLRISDEAAIASYLRQASVTRVPGLSAPG